MNSTKMEGCLQFPAGPAAFTGKTRPKIYGRVDDLKQLRVMYEVASMPQGVGGRTEYTEGRSVSSDGW